MHDTAYLRAVRDLFDLVADQLGPLARPIVVYVAGGAAVHWYTGDRATNDVDAEFARRGVLVGEMLIRYTDESGALRSLYLDRTFNPSFSPLHEDYQQDARSVGGMLGGKGRLDIRVLTPLDLAVSKLVRWSPNDRDDVVALARLRAFDARQLESRAREALEYTIGIDKTAVEANIREAATRVDSEQR